MSNRARVLLGIGGVLGVLAVGCMGFFGSIFVSFPASQGARIDGGDFVGIETSGAYAWVIPSDNGVVLVDAGMDPEATALKAEIGDRTVHAVLVTHGHLDHVAGIGAIDPLITYVGDGERGIAQGTEAAGSLMTRLLGSVMEYPDPPPKMVQMAPYRVLEIDGLRVRTIPMPGHTPGSTAYQIGDTVFTGDAALGHAESIAPVHWAFCTDHAQAVDSIRRLEDMGERMADGHAGLHDDLQAKLVNTPR